MMSSYNGRGVGPGPGLCLVFFRQVQNGRAGLLTEFLHPAVFFGPLCHPPMREELLPLGVFLPAPDELLVLAPLRPADRTQTCGSPRRRRE